MLIVNAGNRHHGQMQITAIYIFGKDFFNNPLFGIEQAGCHFYMNNSDFKDG